MVYRVKGSAQFFKYLIECSLDAYEVAFEVAFHAVSEIACGYLLESQWTKLSDGNWYYCLPGGYVAKNQWVGDYYVGWNGAMVTNTWVGDYFVGADGKWNPNAKK